MIRFLLTLSLVAAVIVPGKALAQLHPRAPNWDRLTAMKAAHAPESLDALGGLSQLLRERNEDELRLQLDAIIGGSLSSQPGRDYVLYRFAVSLADAPQTQAWIIDQLAAAEPSVFVSHPDNALIGVPMFNIRAAAEGARGQVARREARGMADSLLIEAPRDWVAVYLSAGAAERKGFTDALMEAGDESLRQVLDMAIGVLSTEPEITPIAGRAALLIGDAESLQSVVRYGGGSELAPILEAAASSFDSQAVLTLLEVALSEAPPVNGALAIAQLYPALSDNPAARSILIDALGDRDLGASAALALAQGDDPVLMASLEEIARSDHGLAARRASLALQTIHNAGRMGQ